MLRWLLLLCCLSAGRLVRAEVEEAAPNNLGRSAIPIVGYDDKSGWLFGGAGFLYSEQEPGINAGLFFITNLNSFNSGTFNYEQRSEGPWSFAIHLLGERAFDRYYGEGDQTPPDETQFFRIAHIEVKPSVFYRVRPHLRLGAFTDLRARYEEDTQFFPNEASTAFGLHAEWDTRDKLINTRSGDFFQVNLSRQPSDLVFDQLSVDLRHFVRLGRNWTLGNRFVGGTSWGQLSYLFRYRLGGVDLLRGYKDNRFRGAEFFVVQEELRWILKRWLSVNVSVDLGDVRDEAYHQLKASAQLGLRLGLPPDWGQKMRVDLGFGADQMTFQIQFGEIF